MRLLILSSCFFWSKCRAHSDMKSSRSMEFKKAQNKSLAHLNILLTYMVFKFKFKNSFIVPKLIYDIRFRDASSFLIVSMVYVISFWYNLKSLVTERRVFWPLRGFPTLDILVHSIYIYLWSNIYLRYDSHNIIVPSEVMLSATKQWRKLMNECNIN